MYVVFSVKYLNFFKMCICTAVGSVLPVALMRWPASEDGAGFTLLQNRVRRCIQQVHGNH